MDTVIKDRLVAMWNRRLIDRCAIAITAPKNGKAYDIESPPERYEDRVRFWTDGEWVRKRRIKQIESTYYCGDAFPLIMPDLGAAGHAGFFKGINYEFRNTVWFSKLVQELDAPLSFDSNSFLYKKTVELAQYLVDNANDEYMVSMPDTCGNVDALAHIMGSSELMMAMYEGGEVLSGWLDNIQTAWESITNDVHSITKENNHGGGSIGWLDLWAPGKIAQMQCDLSVMIDNGMFREFVVPELVKQSAMLDYGLYHFDGVEQIRHLDSILAIDGIRIIQWQRVSGQESVLNYLDSLKKIQAAGKCLQVMVYPAEIEKVMTELSSKGLHLRVKAENPRQADDMLKIAEKLTRE